jgi:hypothetical protein
MSQWNENIEMKTFLPSHDYYLFLYNTKINE